VNEGTALGGPNAARNLPQESGTMPTGGLDFSSLLNQLSTATPPQHQRQPMPQMRLVLLLFFCMKFIFGRSAAPHLGDILQADELIRNGIMADDNGNGVRYFFFNF
jgi:hypothetical protein